MSYFIVLYKSILSSLAVNTKLESSAGFHSHSFNFLFSVLFDFCSMTVKRGKKHQLLFFEDGTGNSGNLNFKDVPIHKGNIFYPIHLHSK